MNVCIITWPGHNWARSRLKGLWDWHIGRGDKPYFTNLRIPQSAFEKHLKRPDVAYVYNGEYSEAKPIVKYLKECGTMVKFLEVAWFPQHKFWYFDDMGTNGHSMFYHDDLSWVTQEHVDQIDTIRNEQYGGAEWDGAGSGDILVPLQLDKDTAVYKFGQGYNNQRLINKAAEMEPDKRLIIRPHPKDKDAMRCQIPDNAVMRLPGEDQPLMQAICSAEKVIGINSTVLLEAALVGAPVTHLGKCFLGHPAGQEKALAALVARQVPMREKNLDPWAVPHLGLNQPLRTPNYHAYPRQQASEFETLCQYVRLQQPRTIMEIGSCRGRSVIRLAEAAMPALEKVVIIDLPAGVWGEADSEIDLVAAAEHLRTRGVEVILHLGDSRAQEAAAVINDHGPIDFIMLDGDHTIEGVCADWDTAWSNLAVGGSVAFHDIVGDEKRFMRYKDPSGMWAGKRIRIGVPRLWRAIKKSNIGECEQFVDTSSGRMGIGVIKKIKDTPNSVVVTETAPKH